MCTPTRRGRSLQGSDQGYVHAFAEVSKVWKDVTYICREFGVIARSWVGGLGLLRWGATA